MSIPYKHEIAVHNKDAARVVLPLVFRQGHPESVLDVGSGLGTWLSVCQELGVKDILGVDGNYVTREQLTIDANQFKSLDLRQPFDLGRKFDLVICLEVAEHLPDASAEGLVASLVSHGDTILFSAAIPGQPGQNHINEQWPGYWQAKFEKHDYHFHDELRPLIWDDERIEWWYRQNIFLVKRGLRPAAQRKDLTLIHQGLYRRRLSDEIEYKDSLMKGKQGLVVGMRIFFNSIFYKLHKLFHERKP